MSLKRRMDNNSPTEFKKIHIPNEEDEYRFILASELCYGESSYKCQEESYSYDEKEYDPPEDQPHTLLTPCELKTGYICTIFLLPFSETDIMHWPESTRIEVLFNYLFNKYPYLDEKQHLMSLKIPEHRRNLSKLPLHWNLKKSRLPKRSTVHVLIQSTEE